MSLPVIDRCTCPNCGQPVKLRLGIRLPPRLALMFDFLERGPHTMDELVTMFHPGKPVSTARRNVSTAIHNMNEMLVSTDARVSSDGRKPNPTYTLRVREAA